MRTKNWSACTTVSSGDGHVVDPEAAAVVV